MSNKLIGLIALAVAAQAAWAQTGPSDLNFDGTLFDVAGNPILQNNVNFKFEILDKNSTCVLYSEEHLAQDLSASKGSFAVKLGTGTSAQNKLQGNTSFTSALFLNQGSVAPFSGCASGLTLASGDGRNIRVYYNLGSGYMQMNPDFPMSTVPYALIADSLNGKAASDFIHVNAATQLTQANADYVFSSTNYPKLKDLVDGVTTQYMPTTPTAAVSFNSQRLTNLGTPTAAQDAVTKSYGDSNMGGKVLDVSGVSVGVGGGRTLIWDQVANKWVTGVVGTVTAISAGNGLVGGMITAAGTVEVDVGTTANKILQLNGSAQLPAVDGSLLTGVSAAKLQGYSVSAVAPAADQVLTWNAGSSMWVPKSLGGGTITALTGDVSASGSGAVAATINNDTITSAKIKSTGIAVNRLLITDGTAGTTVDYMSCNVGEVLQWTASGWACMTIPTMLGNSGAVAGTYGTSSQVAEVTLDAQGRVTYANNVNIAFPVTSVAGKTGAVTLNAVDIGGLGTAATKDFGAAVGNLVELDGTARIPVGLIPPSIVTQWTTSGGNVYYSSGNVGVGTAAPSERLHVHSGGAPYPLRLESTNPATGVKMVGSNSTSTIQANYIGGYAVTEIDTGGDGLPEMTIQKYSGSIGKVGINMNANNIWSNLDVAGDGNSPVISAETDHPSMFPTIELHRARGSLGAPTPVQAGDNLGGFSWSAYGAGFSSVPGARISALATEAHNGSTHGSKLQFETFGNGAAGLSTRMTIDNNGNVGIGTAAPAMPLDVQVNMASGSVARVMNSNGSNASVALQVVNAGTGGALQVGASGSPIKEVRTFSGVACGFTGTPYATGAGGSCTVSGPIAGAGVNPSSMLAVSCSPMGLMSAAVVHSCVVTGTDTVQINIFNFSGSGFTPPSSWNITFVKF